jgi:predicted PurR-regulated permease PerM
VAQTRPSTIQPSDAPITPSETTVPAAPSVAPAAEPVAAKEAIDTGPIPLSLPSWRTLARWVLVVLALYGLGWLLWRALSALTPFIIGLVLAYLLSPFVNRLAQKMPRWLAILTVYVAGTVLFVVGFAFVVPPLINQVEQLINSIPTIAQMQELGRDVIAQYERAIPQSIRTQIDPAVIGALQGVRENIGANAQRIATFVLTQVLTIVNTITFLIGFLIIPIWLFYVLNDQREAGEFVNRLLHPRLRPDFWNVLKMINKVFSDYIRGQVILCVAVGIAVGVGLLILRLLGFEVRYILLLSIVAGITEFIPVVGPILGAIPAIAVAIFTSPETAVAVLVLYIIVQQLENNFLVPRIVGESVGVHPAILTVALIAMGQVFGLIGVILSAPLSAIARDLFIYIYDRLGGSSAHGAMEHVQFRTKVANSEPRALTGERKAS